MGKLNRKQRIEKTNKIKSKIFERIKKTSEKMNQDKGSLK